jgi:hypothetical protein
MTLEALEFLRRFLLHQLPRGLQRIRQYGLLTNRRRTTQLARCRQLLGQGHATAVAAEPSALADGLDPSPARQVCPACGSSRLTIVAVLPVQPALAPGARPPP